jgi:hypothetical protein
MSEIVRFVAVVGFLVGATLTASAAEDSVSDDAIRAKAFHIIQLSLQCPLHSEWNSSERNDYRLTLKGNPTEFAIETYQETTDTETKIKQNQTEDFFKTLGRFDNLQVGRIAKNKTYANPRNIWIEFPCRDRKKCVETKTICPHRPKVGKWCKPAVEHLDGVWWFPVCDKSTAETIIKAFKILSSHDLGVSR